MEFNLHAVSSEEKERDFDVVIVGAGAAGFSAAVYAARSGFSVAILDKAVAGGLTAEAPLVENYLGFKSIVGSELAKLFADHAANYAKIREGVEVRSIKKTQGGFDIETNDDTYHAKYVIITTGTTHKHLGVKGESEYFGKGTSYCSTCDGYLFKGKRVVTIGGGNSGAIAAISMSEYVKNVTIIEYMPKYMCENAYVQEIKKRNIPYIMNAQVTEIVGDGKKVTGVKYKDRTTGEEKLIETDGVFIYVGLIPQTSFLKDSGVKLDERGYIVVDSRQRTSVPGVYAAGDVTSGNFAQIASAVGDGCKAALSLYSDSISKK
ncbi:probable thioredoxin reductase [Thermoplasma acidophilum]|uniref:Probable thioredoxin reductase n=1 Tax=Thermoplasma acidophilum (strain ATCC 25905 / DSM 1728 / JCM 9062 / NBRC 15155 / AMRC-C165) TaxID=273075 RepID=Q9HJI4_THEAC|nr:NAD(P)/FAD-dependent oxidoreductase [Thermoplasma acidophilum]3CTY_A Chain A, Thioredoxin reductase [Thermoplasma acidophilum]3CTY_B Chain B, Thioredoxin reductase [Thermoplasma acidophilum]CAC12113.1 probable thioredoxin reductase [Thermoplasma acidophilum]